MPRRHFCNIIGKFVDGIVLRVDLHINCLLIYERCLVMLWRCEFYVCSDIGNVNIFNKWFIVVANILAVINRLDWKLCLFGFMTLELLILAVWHCSSDTVLPSLGPTTFAVLGHLSLSYTIALSVIQTTSVYKLKTKIKLPIK